MHIQVYKVARILESVLPDLRIRCPLDAKSFVRGPKTDPPGAPGTVFDLKCTSWGAAAPHRVGWIEDNGATGGQGAAG